MSVRPNAPYRDRVEDDGATLIYEGHDIPRSAESPDPKSVDQPEFTPTGGLTENGRFHRAAQDYRQGQRPAELVRVYEKIRPNIWSYNGLFRLVDSRQESDGRRRVFKFKLEALDDSASNQNDHEPASEHRRIIPSAVKQEVWMRDGGKCRVCGAITDLHFDHIIPYSRGGSSETADNIQILCSRHNIEKRDRIE